MYDRFAAIVPAYNAAARIGGVIEGLARHIPPGNIVVVDDGSLDETASTAERAGVRVLRHEANRGKGAAIRSGIEVVSSLPNIDAIVMLDADGQHDPEEIPRFVEEFSKEKADFIIGNRMSDRSAMPALRSFTNRLTSAIVSMRAGQWIPDSQNGYRLIRASLLTRLHLASSRYEIDSELIIKACRAGGVVASIPSRTIYAGEKSAIHPLRDTVRFIVLVIRSLFW
jgi:glycosyltransferase involved in cell wall biosynthesis